MGVTPCSGAASSVSIWGLHTAPGRMVPEDNAGTSPGAAQKLRLLPHSFCPRFLSRTLPDIRIGAVCARGSWRHSCPPLSHPVPTVGVDVPEDHQTKRSTTAISEVMEAAGEHQNEMRPHGTRTATSPVQHSGGDGALAHTWAWLSIVWLEPAQYLTLSGEASSHNTKLKNDITVLFHRLLVTFQSSFTLFPLSFRFYLGR